MKSVVIHPPHHLSVEETPLEEIGPGQVTIAVRAGGICGPDMH
jgi:L-idonate 5-dehydrogenase